MFLKINYKNSRAISTFLTNQPMDNECSALYFNSFSCNFCFDNTQKVSLEKLFQNGSYISPFLEHWLNQNTNLIQIPGNKKHDFVDEHGQYYQLKTFTKNGLKFRPSSQLGIGRTKNQKEFEEYCYSQMFIIASVVTFPIVKFKIFKGEYLLKTFKSGHITLKKYNVIFP